MAAVERQPGFSRRNVFACYGLLGYATCADAGTGRTAVSGEWTARVAHHFESALAPSTRKGAGSAEVCASARVSVKWPAGGLPAACWRQGLPAVQSHRRAQPAAAVRGAILPPISYAPSLRRPPFGDHRPVLPCSRRGVAMSVSPGTRLGPNAITARIGHAVAQLRPCP